MTSSIGLFSRVDTADQVHLDGSGWLAASWATEGSVCDGPVPTGHRHGTGGLARDRAYRELGEVAEVLTLRGLRLIHEWNPGATSSSSHVKQLRQPAYRVGSYRDRRCRTLGSQ